MKQSKEAIDELNKNSLQQIQDIIDEAKLYQQDQPVKRKP